jgi:SAM-dependent methyltransferase
MPFFEELLACPRCRGGLSGFGGTTSDSTGLSAPPLRCASCGDEYPSPKGIPALRILSDARTEKVREFYARAPFPGYPPRDTLSAMRARAARSEFARGLDRAIPGDARVLELGCGTGQLSLYLATADRVVVGADLARPSLELAREAGDRFGLKGVLFLETDLNAPGLARGAFDVVICSGVLHHTPDPRKSFASVAQLVRPGGVLVIGLYNAYARLPQRLRRAAGFLTGYRWIPGDRVLRERESQPARRDAWFQDQYRHVEEHRHTLREVQTWFRENGIEYLRAYPSALLAGESDELFAQAEDDWAVEGWIAQLSWIRSIGGEGGVFATIGCRPS